MDKTPLNSSALYKIKAISSPCDSWRRGGSIMFRWFLFKLQIKLPVLSLLQGKVSITLGLMSHLRDGPMMALGLKIWSMRSACGQTLQPFLNKCSPCVWLLFSLPTGKLPPAGRNSWTNNFPLHTRLSLLWESFCLKITHFWQQAAENRKEN